MSQTVDRNSQSQSEVGLLMPRLKSFALSLTGSETVALALLRATRAHALAHVDRERGHAPVALWTLIQMRKIWAKKFGGRNGGGGQADPRLFQPMSRIDDGGTSARLAIKIGRLDPLQRGLLHLVYGERLSYDEAAEIFDIPVTEVISALVSAHTAIAGKSAAPSPKTADDQPFPYEKTARQQERAA